MHNTFKKGERLCSKKQIDALFAQKNSFFSYPFVVRWQINASSNDSKYPAQILIIVPKRKLHHAIDRNRAKRLIRECYRLQKHQLYNCLISNNLHICFSFSFVDTKIPNFHILMQKTADTLDTLCQNIKQVHQAHV